MNGARFKQVREKFNLSIRELHIKSGISETYLREIEADKKNPTIEKITQLANGYGISEIELLGHDYIIDNIKLIMGNLNAHEFSEDIKKKTGISVPDEADLNDYLNNERLPGNGTLQNIAFYAGIDFSFFYKKNTNISLVEEQKRNAAVTNESPEFIKLCKKIKSSGIDYKTIETIIDALIAQKNAP